MSNTRRAFVKNGIAALAVAIAPGGWKMYPGTRQLRFLFVSQGKTLIMNIDGTGLRVLEFNKPDQVTWQPGGIFQDGERILLLSMEPRRDGPGRPFEEYYTQTPTHLWIHHLDNNTLEEIAVKERMAVFYTPALLLSDERMLVQVSKGKTGQIFSMNLDGSGARTFTKEGEGLPYGLSRSPDGNRIAFHLASPDGYQVYTSDLEGGNRIRIAADPQHLYFGTSWSPDGKWILYADCDYTKDLAHDWADVCVGRADGSEHRVLTNGQAMWFSASYGKPGLRGGGSNTPSWTKNGKILFPRRMPGSKVPWEYQANRPDTDHYNRDYKPGLSRGGTQICRIDPATGKTEALTDPGEGFWDFRASESPDGKHILFCRAQTGAVPALWVMDADGHNPHLLTKGIDDKGVDQPRWLA